MIWKGLKKRNILEQRNDEIDWKKTTFLALITSVDAFLAGIGISGSANDPPVTDDFPNYSTECNWWCICRI